MATQAPGPIFEQTLSADGNTSYQTVVGRVWVSVSGDFGSGGTAKVQRKNVAGTAVDIAGASYTAAGDDVIDFSDYAVNEVRVNLSGATSPSLKVSFQWTSPYAVLRTS